MKTIGYVFLAALFVLVLSGEEVSVLYEESSYWPTRVQVDEEVVGQTHGNKVEPGAEWTFLRYQGGDCIVDMGHNGIHAVDAKNTDLLDRMRHYQKTRKFPFQGLFTFRSTKSFYMPESPEKGLELGVFDEYDYFVLFYFEYSHEEPASQLIGEFLRAEAKTLERDNRAKVLLLPENNVQVAGLVEDYKADGFTNPTVIPFLYSSLEHSLYHRPNQKGDVVLVDSFGKILGQFFLDDIPDAKTEDLARVLETILQEARS